MAERQDKEAESEENEDENEYDEEDEMELDNDDGEKKSKKQLFGKNNISKKMQAKMKAMSRLPKSSAPQANFIDSKLIYNY